MNYKYLAIRCNGITWNWSNLCNFFIFFRMQICMYWTWNKCHSKLNIYKIRFVKWISDLMTMGRMKYSMNYPIWWQHGISQISRFSSQQYTLRSFHESVHLCNNAIQRKYFNGKRSHRLPLQNMWAKETFLDFLRAHNLGNHASVIDSGIKKAIIG